MKCKYRITRFVGVCTLVAAIVGCSDENIADVKNQGSPGDTPATLAKRIARTNSFALDLYQQLRTSSDNLILSPHSIITCFGMAYAGARGNTERQIADILNFNYPQGGFHSALKQLNDLLENRQGLTLQIANGCWGQQGSTILPAYVDTLAAAYGAVMEYLDFGGQPELARQTINTWVQQNTMGFIKDILAPGELDAMTYLVLANTVYFSAQWLHCFKPDYTHSSSFDRLDGSSVSVSFMNGEETMPYYQGDGYKAMEMPYQGQKLSMVLILPDPGQFESFEASLDTAVLDSVLRHLQDRHITFGIPKFGFFSKYKLDSSLQAMGLTDPFVPGVANFTGMDGIDDGQPWIDLVLHKAYIAIDEYGTLAAAGTVMELSIGVHDHFQASRPFIFLIRDIDTGTILFLGRVLDPSVG